LELNCIFWIKLVMKKMISAGVIVYRMSLQNTREYLLLEYTAGHWDFAKGKVEQGETLKRAALRELEEEAGIKVQLLPNFSESFSYYLIDYNGEKAFKTVHFFIGQELSDQIVKLSHEHTDYSWMSYDSAYEKLTYKNAKETLEKVETFLNKKANL